MNLRLSQPPVEPFDTLLRRAAAAAARRELLSLRSDLRFDAVDDRWWRPWRRRARLARLAAVEAALHEGPR